MERSQERTPTQERNQDSESYTSESESSYSAEEEERSGGEKEMSLGQRRMETVETVRRPMSASPEPVEPRNAEGEKPGYIRSVSMEEAMKNLTPRRSEEPTGRTTTDEGRT